MKHDSIVRAVQHVCEERDMVRGIVRRIDDSDFIYRDDMRRSQGRDIHSEYAQHISAVVRERV
jgi:hypothetical protein